MWRSERRSGRYRHNNITPPEIAVPLGISARSATLTEEPSENAPLQSRFGSLESVFLSGPSGSSKKTKTLDVGAELRREEVAQQVVAKKETDDMITLTTEIDGLEDKMRELSALAEKAAVIDQETLERDISYQALDYDGACLQFASGGLGFQHKGDHTSKGCSDPSKGGWGFVFKTPQSINAQGNH